jgi:catalase
LTSQ